MSLRLLNGSNWWNLRIDAETGHVLSQNDWVVSENLVRASTDANNSTPLTDAGVVPNPLQNSQLLSGEYRVFPIPLESPQHQGAAHTLVSEPADPVASPLGWHDTDGVAGAEFTDTRGNNVFAQEDVDGNNSGGFRPDGGPGLFFDFPWDPDQEPDQGTNQEAAIVNLFYWNNIIHDVLYQYGFDEAAGNFQQNNYGRGGLSGDPVQADGQDGSGVNNANFATPPDGFDPRMQMFIWRPPFTHQVSVASPATIAGDYTASGALFGPSLDQIGLTSDLVAADDGSGDPSDACQPLINGGLVAGNIALIDRGSCDFVVKVKNAQNAGAIGAIVANNSGDGLIPMGGSDPTIVIPSVFIGRSDGNVIKGELVTGVVGTIRLADSQLLPNRDSDLDNGIIIHEYGHGVSNRLTGGPGNVACLFNREQMGEGWSDWLALALTARPGDQGLDRRPIGTYVVFESPTDTGIRTFPYSTDMSVNPHTYNDIGSLSIPHGVGSVWAAMAWEMYWNFVSEYGFDADVYRGRGGNNLAIRLVIDGMKLQNCSPHFIDGRNAILLADIVNYAAVNQCLIWQAFAKRGLGLSANAGSSNSVTDGTEAFDLPAACANPVDMRSVDVALRPGTPYEPTVAAGSVSVVDVADAPLGGALVSATWMLPDGSTVTQRNLTNTQGVAWFRIGDAGPGSYTLTVENVTKAGFFFDLPGSVLTDSIILSP